MTDAPSQDRPLTELAELDDAQRQRLAALWITSVMEFLSTHATPAGRAGLRDALSVDAERLDEIVAAARKLVGKTEPIEPRPGGRLGVVLEEPDAADDEEAGR